MPIENVLAALAPVAGSFGSAALQQRYARRNWDAVNAYNHPKQQVARLKEAGLPLATMFGGQGGSTSSPINTPNVDPTLGVAEGLGKFMQVGQVKRQNKLMDAEIRIKEAEAALKEDELGFQLGTTIDSSDGQVIQDYEPALGDSNQVLGIKRDRAIREAEKISKGIENDLKGIEQEVKNRLNSGGYLDQDFIEKVRKTIMESTSLSVHIKNEELRRRLANDIIEDLDKGGTGWQGIMRLAKGVVFRFLMGN